MTDHAKSGGSKDAEGGKSTDVSKGAATPKGPGGEHLTPGEGKPSSGANPNPGHGGADEPNPNPGGHNRG